MVLNWKKSMNRISIYVCAAVFLLVGSLCTQATENIKDAPDGTAMVWVQNSDGNFPVFFSAFDGKQWKEPLIVSENEKLNLVPSITKGDKGEIWVVWTLFDKGETDLFFKYYADGSWSDEQKIETGLAANIASSILFDDEKVLWLVWAGSDGQDDDIYYTRWNGSAFEPAERITDNSVPDVLPVLGMTSKGKVWVQWKYYGDSGYETMVSEWKGTEWSEAKLADGNFFLKYASVKEPAGEAEELEIELPEFVSDPRAVSVFVPDQEIQSIPIRLMDESTDIDATNVMPQ